MLNSPVDSPIPISESAIEMYTNATILSRILQTSTKSLPYFGILDLKFMKTGLIVKFIQVKVAINCAR